MDCCNLFFACHFLNMTSFRVFILQSHFLLIQVYGCLAEAEMKLGVITFWRILIYVKYNMALENVYFLIFVPC
jgi:hypothetical protein